MYIGNVMLLILNLPLVPLFAQVLRTPVYVLYPLILGVSIVGIYGSSGSLFDLMLLAGFGLLGYLMRKLDYPSAPLILGVVLGGAMERALRQSLMMSEGSLSILVFAADLGADAIVCAPDSADPALFPTEHVARARTGAEGLMKFSRRSSPRSSQPRRRLSPRRARSKWWCTPAPAAAAICSHARPC